MLLPLALLPVAFGANVLIIDDADADVLRRDLRDEGQGQEKRENAFHSNEFGRGWRAGLRLASPTPQW